MLGLRLDDPLPLAGSRPRSISKRLLGWNGSGSPSDGGDEVALTRRGRFLGGGVTVELLAEIPQINYNCG